MRNCFIRGSVVRYVLVSMEVSTIWRCGLKHPLACDYSGLPIKFRIFFSFEHRLQESLFTAAKLQCIARNVNLLLRCELYCLWPSILDSDNFRWLSISDSLPLLCTICSCQLVLLTWSYCMMRPEGKPAVLSSQQQLAWLLLSAVSREAACPAELSGTGA